MKVSEFKPASGRRGGVQLEEAGGASIAVRTFLDPVRMSKQQGFPAAALCANSAGCVGYPHWKPLKACLGNDLRRIRATSHHVNMLLKPKRAPKRPLTLRVAAQRGKVVQPINAR